MKRGSKQLIADIRSASRVLVRELGFMNRTLAGTHLTPSEVHAILEIGMTIELSAKQLAETLILEKSTVSRLVKSLVLKGEIIELVSQKDARIKTLSLSNKGKSTLRKINRYAQTQVASVVNDLDADSRNVILVGLQKYAHALGVNRTQNDVVECEHEPLIYRGYYPTLIGRVVAMHASYYSSHAGFGQLFEKTIAADMANFIDRINSPQNAIWTVHMGSRIVGSIGVDGEDLDAGQAHLRWFILEEEAQGMGLGKGLLEKAIEFCDQQGFNEVHLWTFEGLDQARKLYEMNGFKLFKECRGSQWGKEVLEQQFVRFSKDSLKPSF
ncbi:MAG: bifunctional helix-turn-helix transcriptional regulator/GNAT family N-acetyltransferase [Arenicella sp.]